jgi:DNA-binding GntR family transcriptional regulator
MPVQRRSLKDQVKQQILERIFKGRYTPGQRLREVALAKELNTSPIPVREALRELESLICLSRFRAAVRPTSSDAGRIAGGLSSQHESRRGAR